MLHENIEVTSVLHHQRLSALAAALAALVADAAGERMTVDGKRHSVDEREGARLALYRAMKVESEAIARGKLPLSKNDRASSPTSHQRANERRSESAKRITRECPICHRMYCGYEKTCFRCARAAKARGAPEPIATSVSKSTKQGEQSLPPLLYKKAEVYAVLKIRETTLYRLELRGILKPVLGLGRHKHYRVADVHRIAEQGASLDA